MVGLAHAIPDAALQLDLRDGRTLEVGHRPNYELDLCSLRQAVLHSDCPRHPNLTDWITDIRPTGSITPEQAGLFTRTAPDSSRQWWFATLLRPETAGHFLRAIDADSNYVDLEAVLRPDPCLAVTVVGISGMSWIPAADQLAIALEAYESCLVEELIHSGRTRSGLK